MLFGAAESRVPTLKRFMQIVVQDVDSNLEQKMGAVRHPTHLLFLEEAFGDGLIDGRCHETGRNALASSFPAM